MKYTCPICDYPDLDEEPYGSFEICPRCYCEFGLDDGSFAKDSQERADWLAALRLRWETDGRLWPQDPIRNPNLAKEILERAERIPYNPKWTLLEQNQIHAAKALAKEVLEHWEKTKIWLYCPVEAEQVYRDYMAKHKIEYQEVDQDGRRCFLLDKKHDPHSWELPELDNPL